MYLGVNIKIQEQAEEHIQMIHTRLRSWLNNKVRNWSHVPHQNRRATDMQYETYMPQ